MPYTRVGNKVYKKEGGKRKLVQTCKSAGNAKKAIRARYANEKVKK